MTNRLVLLLSAVLLLGAVSVSAQMRELGHWRGGRLERQDDRIERLEHRNELRRELRRERRERLQERLRERREFRLELRDSHRDWMDNHYRDRHGRAN